MAGRQEGRRGDIIGNRNWKREKEQGWTGLPQLDSFSIITLSKRDYRVLGNGTADKNLCI